MGKIAQKYWKHILFTMVGATLGFTYWKFVGCTSGTCPITANWHTSVLFGSLIGWLAVPARKNKTGDNTKTGSDIQTENNTKNNSNNNTD